MKVPKYMLQAELAPAKEEQGRIADLKWYTGATIARMSWDGRYYLTLSMKPEHVRMGRLQSGKAPLLNSHSDYSLADIIGVIESADLKGNARVRFSSRAEVDGIWADVQDGIIRNASVGARIYKMKDVTEKDEEGNEKTKTYLAIDWEPLEVSLVPIGADPNAGLKLGEEASFTEAEVVSAGEPTGAISPHILPTGGAKMADKAVTDAGEKSRETITVITQTLSKEQIESEQKTGALGESARVRDIIATVEKLGLPASFGYKHIHEGTKIERFRDLAIDEQVRLASMLPETGPTGARAVMLRDEVDTRRHLMGDAIAGMMDRRAAKNDPNNPFIGLSIKQIASESMRLQRGLRGTPPIAQVVEFAMQTTSDFSSVLEAVARKQLLAMYQLANPTYRLWTKRSTTPDFKAMSRTRLGEAPTFLKVPEGGQITIGLMTDAKESYSLATYGRGVSFTRQMLINDDLGAFNDLIGAFGAQAARLENKTIYAILTANAAMADNVTLFHADHDNSGTGVIGNTALDAMWTAMRTQKGIDGASILNITPRFLIAPAAKESTARAALMAIGPNVKAADQNWFAGRLEPVADGELDATSTAVWYAAADPTMFPGIEYCHLEGAEGPQFVRKDNESGILGIQFYAFLDFAAKAVDWRPLYYSTGA